MFRRKLTIVNNSYVHVYRHYVPYLYYYESAYHFSYNSSVYYT